MTGYEKPRLQRLTHKCGVCRTNVTTARWRDSGLLVHVELITERARPGRRLDIVPELFAGAGLPHVELRPLGRFIEHVCAGAAR